MGHLLYIDASRGLRAEALHEALSRAGHAEGARVYASPLPLGGTRDLPASLLAGVALAPGEAPCDEPGLRALLALSPHWEAPPPFRAAGAVETSSAGAVLRVLWGEASSTIEEEVLWVLEANVDDLSPQVVEVFIAHAFRAGALDAWSQALAMKKGRPALLLGALCREEARAAVEEVFFRETSTLGVRASRVVRRALERRFIQVQTKFGEVSLKLGLLRGEVVNAQPEFEDARRRAQEAGAPVKQVLAAALAAYWRAQESG